MQSYRNRFRSTTLDEWNIKIWKIRLSWKVRFLLIFLFTYELGYIKGRNAPKYVCSRMTQNGNLLLSKCRNIVLAPSAWYTAAIFYVTFYRQMKNKLKRRNDCQFGFWILTRLGYRFTTKIISHQLYFIRSLHSTDIAIWITFFASGYNISMPGIVMFLSCQLWKEEGEP